MSGRVVFLLEEPSMKVFLQAWLPRIVPGWLEGTDFLLVPHEGKSDLDRSVPVKLKAWREPGTRFVIVRDNDGADCISTKKRLLELIAGTGRTAVVRLICQELEGWNLADEVALRGAYPTHVKAVERFARRFPDPDACRKPSVELGRDIDEFQKQDAARRLGARLDAARSRSASCRLFARTVKSLAAVAA
jgi:hypothetical protein